MKAHLKNSILVFPINLALRVESLLDNIIDPAEHQIAVESLVVISRIEERNPELTLCEKPIDLKVLIDDAIKGFWDKWISEQSNQNFISPFISKTVKKAIDTSAFSPLVTGPPLDLPDTKKMHIQITALQSVSRRIGDVKSSTSSLHDKLEPPTNSPNQGTDLSFEKNERLARRIFFDLRQDGNNGTMSYLAASCVRHAFGVSWVAEHTQGISFEAKE